MSVSEENGITRPLVQSTVLRGRYVLVSRRADTAAGSAYRAEDQDSGRTVTVKELVASLLNQTQQKWLAENFERECAILDGLDHPSVLKVSDHFFQDDRYYLVTNAVPGQDLASGAKGNQPLDERQVTRWAIQICNALWYLHSRQHPTVYRDLKPSSVILPDNGIEPILDIGFAQMAGPWEDWLDGNYAAPEAIQGTADARSDLYSLGVIIRWLLRGGSRDLGGRPGVVSEGMQQIIARLTGNPNQRPPGAFDALFILQKHYAALQERSSGGLAAGSGARTVDGVPAGGSESSTWPPAGQTGPMASGEADYPLAGGNSGQLPDYIGAPAGNANPPVVGPSMQLPAISTDELGSEPGVAPTEPIDERSERASLADQELTDTKCCPVCGRVQASHFRFCVGCGSSLDSLDVGLKTVKMAVETEHLNAVQVETASPPRTSTSPLAYDEDVMFTVFRPSVVVPERWYSLLAFAHLSKSQEGEDEIDPLAEVQRQAQQVLGEKMDSYRPLAAESSTAVPRAGEIVFIPYLPGVEFNPEVRSFRWEEPVHREEFKFRAPKSLAGQVVRGCLRAYLGPLILAEINLSVRVDNNILAESGAQLQARESARPLRKVFASYSHQDVEIVERIEELVAQSHLGIEYLRDATKLRSGEVWNDELMNMIRAADMFQLFWSWNSMYSKYVRQEIDYALSLRRPNFVLPVYWETPFPEQPRENLPPEELRRLHFERLGAIARTAPLWMPAESKMTTPEEAKPLAAAGAPLRLSAKDYATNVSSDQREDDAASHDLSEAASADLSSKEPPSNEAFKPLPVPSATSAATVVAPSKVPAQPIKAANPPQLQLPQNQAQYQPQYPPPRMVAGTPPRQRSKVKLAVGGLLTLGGIALAIFAVLVLLFGSKLGLDPGNVASPPGPAHAGGDNDLLPTVLGVMGLIGSAALLIAGVVLIRWDRPGR